MVGLKTFYSSTRDNAPKNCFHSLYILNYIRLNVNLIQDSENSLLRCTAALPNLDPKVSGNFAQRNPPHTGDFIKTVTFYL